ncbi:MAG: AAA family ATPase [Psychromonas sp.]|nr:AAA family ATPase [Psychromonas sp.]
MAEEVSDKSIKRLLEALRMNYDFIIVDTSSYLTEVSLAILDVADRVVLVTQQSLPCLKSIKRFFDLSDNLEYESDKVWLIVNRASTKQGIQVKRIGDALKRPIIVTIPEDIIANVAADQGVPLVSGGNKNRPISLAIIKLSEHIVQELASDKPTQAAEVQEPKQTGGLFGKLFGKRVRV